MKYMVKERFLKFIYCILEKLHMPDFWWPKARLIKAAKEQKVVYFARFATEPEVKVGHKIWAND